MEKELLLNKLNEILSNKKFSVSVKEKIVETINDAYDCYSVRPCRLYNLVGGNPT